MPGSKFQVKLYGHTSDDVESFCKKLAAVLMVSETEAMLLLHEVPLVVRDNLTGPAAENLSKLLTSIRALSIAEPMDGAVVEKTRPIPEPLAPTIARTIESAGERQSMDANFWMYLGLGLAGFLIVSVIVGVISSYVNLYSGAPTATRTPAEQERAMVTEAHQIDENAMADLQLRVDRLETQYEELGVERDAANKDMYVADYRLRIPGEMETRRARLRSVQAEMRSVLKELADARLELARMKKASGKKGRKREE
jgi:hypothetical protein